VKSPKAARLAVEGGYTNVHLYQEGLSGWGNAGYGFETKEALPRMRMNLVGPEELERSLQSDPSILIVDIRDDELHDAMRFPYENTIHIPMAYLEDRLKEVPRDRKLVVACHLGKQSMTAGPYLVSRDYDVLGCLDGGMMGWQKAGKSVVK
jgi:rhodanese-related sulfurtransferase